MEKKSYEKPRRVVILILGHVDISGRLSGTAGLELR